MLYVEKKKFGMLFVLVWVSTCLCVHGSLDAISKNLGVSGSNHLRKRVVGGRPLPSHSLYQTQFFVQLRETWSCVSDQIDHVLKDCWHKFHCGGAVVHPRFVLTACHCMSYSVFYALEYQRPLPKFPDIEPLDVPSYFSPNWKELAAWGLSVIENVKPFHPLLNAMTLWAGSADGTKMTQRRHASAFYPHHYCVHYQMQDYPEKWPSIYHHFEFDVGLVKTCSPFILNKDVRLAPLLLPPSRMKRQLTLFTSKSFVCLFAGWGITPTVGEDLVIRDKNPDVLHHIWRYVECSENCHRRYPCVLCSYVHGSTITTNSKGDSGSPITCDGFVTGVVSRGRRDIPKNLSVMMDFPTACVADQLTTTYLDKLKNLNDEIYHWLDGKPIPSNPPPI